MVGLEDGASAAWSRQHGMVASTGSTSGVRMVVAAWSSSPLGPYDSVLLERGDGSTLCIAPQAEIAHRMTQAAEVDETRVEEVRVTPTESGWSVACDSLQVRLTFGARTPLGARLARVPTWLATDVRYLRAMDGLVRRRVKGARTLDRLRDRDVYYAATDQKAIRAVSGTLEGAALGEIAPVLPLPRFRAFGSPRDPAVLTLTMITHLLDKPRA